MNDSKRPYSTPQIEAHGSVSSLTASTQSFDPNDPNYNPGSVSF